MIFTAKMEKPKISIFVPIYNEERILYTHIKIILDNIKKITDNFEIIIVDDNSSDNSLEIAKQSAKQDKRVQIYLNEENLGDYHNRNKAASLAKGKYLKYLDADDLIYGHSLSVMVQALEQFPEAALALSSNNIDPPQPYPIFYPPEELYRNHYLGRSPLGVGPSASIIRRESFEAIGGFSGRQFVGDTELWLRMAECWPVVTLPPAMVWWRQHGEQQIQLEITRPEVMNIRHKLQIEMLQATKHLSEDQKLEASRYLSHLHARRLWSLGLRGRRLKTAWSLFRDSDMSVSQLLVGLRRPTIR